VPLLRTIPVARIAPAPGVSERQAKYYRAGTKTPTGRRLRVLLALLERHAKQLLGERQTPTEVRALADGFLARFGQVRDRRIAER
jgi:hypothetical protein